MDDHKPRVFFFAILSFFYCLTPPMSHAQLLPIVEDDAAKIQTYIVHVERPGGSEFLSSEDLESWHKSFLPNTTLDSGEPRLIYSYRDVISGFAARLTPHEVKAMEAKKGFIYAHPDQLRPLATTYTHKFLGLNNWTGGIWSNTFFGQGIVIGVLDTGILPTHPSFHDWGMPPKPVTWKGTCAPSSGVRCNRKIIGAVGFHKGKLESVNDTNGHGTHVASTAAGNFVDDASVLGMAKGTAAGMAPKAHLAIYKVCFKDGCGLSDELKAIDQAIQDGVDVLSMSLGGNGTKRFDLDSIVRGSLSALSHGISAVAAAGNDGPMESSLSRDAPWVLTIGASSTDRRIRATVRLGDGTELVGESAYQPSLFNASGPWPIVFPGEHGDFNKTYCLKNSLDNVDVRGKIVLCWRGVVGNVEKGKVVHDAGGDAMVLGNIISRGYTTSADPHVLPVAQISYRDRIMFQKYYNSGSKSKGFTPNATIIFKHTVFGYRPSPGVASFSSRGPATMNGGILKPDVLAPGVNILGAWPFDVGPSPSALATKTFNFLSGTSMATPHVSGIVALIKNKHRNWSPAYIQSAIITSARDLDLDGNLIVDENSNKTASIFATGAGQVNPAGALDPGLVYNIHPDDYIGYVCRLNYSDRQVKTLFNRTIRCSTVQTIEASSLNYPSIMVSLPRNSRQAVTVNRTVTNVGDANSVYDARITNPTGVMVDLSPYQLLFNRQGQEKSFQVTLRISGSGPGKTSTARGKLEWISNSNKYVVKSPIAIKFV
ncbi:subtilisin-like protease 4 [Elaeis guineensis]|uniref:Subtilisin-like protease SBT1.2 n=1 Tax=Elaeis guineensis var. tenera TaxID=51953 RepID=A0A8N4F4M9_ELAGV|nr:subtilisin-like protease SBT1.2 [Elaeis guineensis]